MSAVVVGRDCAPTLPGCLEPLCAQLGQGLLREVVFVDGGSTDGTLEALVRYPVRIIEAGRTARRGGVGNGGVGDEPGVALNLGTRAARGALVWFISPACGVDARVLERLAARLSDPRTAAVSGGLVVVRSPTRLAQLVHAEHIDEASGGGVEVEALPTFNLMCRVRALEELGGFDETLRDLAGVELGWRALAHGHELAFEPEARVWCQYLPTWRGYWRACWREGYAWAQLARHHRPRARSAARASRAEVGTVLLALGLVASAPFLALSFVRWLWVGGLVAVVACTLPAAWQLSACADGRRALGWIPVLLARALWRGGGFVHGVLARGRRAPRRG